MSRVKREFCNKANPPTALSQDEFLTNTRLRE